MTLVQWETISYYSGTMSSVHTKVPTQKKCWKKCILQWITRFSNTNFTNTERARNSTEGKGLTHWGTELESSSLLCYGGFTLAVPLSFQLASITSRFSFNKQPSIENSIFHSSKCITRKSETQGNKEHLIIRILPLAVVKPHSLAPFQG